MQKKLNGEWTHKNLINQISVNIADFNEGYFTINIDYNNDPQDCIVTYAQWVNGDADRKNPAQYEFDYSRGDPWRFTGGHTIEGIHADMGNHFFVTSSELAGPELYVKDDGSFVNRDYETVPIGNMNQGDGSLLISNDIALNAAGDKFDNRRPGTYIKLWGGDKLHNEMRGAGDNPNSSAISGGHISSYDTREQTQRDRSTNGSNVVLDNNISTIDCSYPENTSVGPNSSHHFRTIFGSTGKYPGNMLDIDHVEKDLRTELYVGNYVAGARVINTRSFLRDSTGFMRFNYQGQQYKMATFNNNQNFSEKALFEEAYFDYMPTLNYDPNSRYFFGLNGIDDEEFRAYEYSNEEIPFPNYFLGTWDCFPDTRRVGLEHDEDFIYAYGRSGHQGPFLKNGGYLILRYFRDEIGGVISGNNPSNPTLYEDMVFRHVNLQGDFKVQRDVEIANGADVWFLPGVEGSIQTHSSSSFNIGDNGEKTITLNGNLHVGFRDAKDQPGYNKGVDVLRSEASEVDIHVPIVINDGGCLLVHEIRENKSRPAYFDKKITVKSGGSLFVTEYARAVFNNIEVEEGGYIHFMKGSDITLNGYNNKIAGKFIIDGTPTDRVTITGKIKLQYSYLDDRRFLDNVASVVAENPRIDKQAFINVIKGNSLDDNDHVSIDYADFLGVKLSCKDKIIQLFDNNRFIDNSDYSYSQIDHLETQCFLGCSEFDSNNPKRNDIEVTNCIFQDKAIIDPVQMNPEQVYNGLLSNNKADLIVDNCSFINLDIALCSYTNTCNIKNNVLQQNQIGMLIETAGGTVCKNDLYINRGGIIVQNSGSLRTSNNKIKLSQTASRVYETEQVIFEYNEINDYYCGIEVEEGTAILKNLAASDPNPIVDCAPGYRLEDKYGRNKFINSVTLPSYSNTYSIYAQNQVITDVFLKHENASVMLRCGKNSFSTDTPNHLYYEKEDPADPDKYIDCDVNLWPNIPNQPKVVNINYTGKDFSKSESLGDDCKIDIECSCKSSDLIEPIWDDYYNFSDPFVPDPSGFAEYIHIVVNNPTDAIDYRILEIDSILEIDKILEIDTLNIVSRTYTFDFSDDWSNNSDFDWRLDGLDVGWEIVRKTTNFTLDVTKLSSSTNTLDEIITLTDSLYNSTKLSNEFKVKFGYILAEAYEHNNQISQAMDIYEDLERDDIFNYPRRSSWELARLKSIYTHTIPDSVEVNERKFLDLLKERHLYFNTKSSGGGSFKGAFYSLNDEISETGISNPSILPNPNNGLFNLSFTSSIKTDANIKVKDLFGREVYFDKVKINLGEGSIPINLKNVVTGQYFVVLEFNENNITLPVLIK